MRQMLSVLAWAVIFLPLAIWLAATFGAAFSRGRKRKICIAVSIVLGPVVFFAAGYSNAYNDYILVCEHPHRRHIGFAEYCP